LREFDFERLSASSFLVVQSRSPQASCRSQQGVSHEVHARYFHVLVSVLDAQIRQTNPAVDHGKVHLACERFLESLGFPFALGLSLTEFAIELFFELIVELNLQDLPALAFNFPRAQGEVSEVMKKNSTYCADSSHANVSRKLSANPVPLEVGFLITAAIWSCCRFYFFMFSVIEYYVEPKFRFSSCFPFFYLLFVGEGVPLGWRHTLDRNATLGATSAVSVRAGLD
jgi:hypothetical protein